MNDYLFQIPEKDYKKVCLKQDGEADISYGDIAVFLPNSLTDLIYRKPICCVCNQTASFVAGFLAIEQAGGIPVLVSHDSTDSAIVDILSTYKIKYIWAPCSIKNTLEGTWDYIEYYCYRDYVFIEVLNNVQMTISIHDDLALMLSTSGSTSEKKYVRLSKENILKSVELVNLIAEFTESDIGLVYLPTDHCFTIGLIHALFSVGACMVCTSGGVMELAREGFIDRYKISVLISVTFIIDFLRKTTFFETIHPSLRVIANGAGATPRETQDFLVDYMQKNGGKLIPTYGQTEVTIVASAVPFESVKKIYNSIGKPYGDIQMSIENMDEKGIGELVIQSSAVMMGYAYNAEDLKEGSVTNNILHTGDLAYKDNNGFYYIVGRTARFAKINGKRISLQYIEDELKKVFCDQEFACVSDDKVLFVMATNQKDNLHELLMETARIAGVHNFIVKGILCDALPRNESGKILYTQVRANMDSREIRRA